jgi:hypothetical protein
MSFRMGQTMSDWPGAVRLPVQRYPKTCTSHRPQFLVRSATPFSNGMITLRYEFLARPSVQQHLTDLWR